jgi:hypothetical protein
VTARPVRPPTKRSVGGAPWAGVAADFIAEGLADAAFTGADWIGALPGRGDGSFAALLNLTTDAAIGALVAIDLDGVGKLDPVAASRDATRLVAALNRAT